MNTNTERRAPSGKASIPGLSPHITGVLLSASINQQAQITVTGLPEKASAASVNQVGSADIIAALVQFQTAKFTGNANTGSVTVNDGAKHKVTFQGIITSPSHSVGVGSLGFNVQMAGVAVRVQSLRTSIYAGISNAYLKEFSTEITGNTYAEIMQQVLDMMIKDYTTAVTQRALLFTAEEKKLREQVGRLNVEGLRIWKQILQDSIRTTGSVALKNATPDVRASIVRYVLDVYSASSGDFWSTISEFCEGFHLVYVPNLGNASATYGMLIDAKAMVGKPISKTTSTTAIQLQLGQYAMTPITGVIVRAPGAALLKEAGADDANQLPEIHSAFYPPEQSVNPGVCAEVSAPPWLPRIAGAADTQLALFQEETNLDPTQFQSEVTRQRLTASLALQIESFKAIMQEWAHGHWLDLSLAGETVSLSTPLDISWVVGTRYAVTKLGGGVMFKGFLAAVQHNFIIGENGGDAATTLTFSHVEAGSFELPNKGDTEGLQGASLQPSSGLQTSGGLGAAAGL